MATDFRLKEGLPDLTERIVRTYSDVGKIHHLGYCPLPSYETIISATEDLKEILYPGYRRRGGLHPGNVSYHVGSLIDRLHDRLTTQIARALRHEVNAESDCIEADDFEALGQAKTLVFLDQLADLRATLAKDVQAAYDEYSSTVKGTPNPKTLWLHNQGFKISKSVRASFLQS